jgi:hypothetical protein
VVVTVYIWFSCGILQLICSSHVVFTIDILLNAFFYSFNVVYTWLFQFMYSLHVVVTVDIWFTCDFYSLDMVYTWLFQFIYCLHVSTV